MLGQEHDPQPPRRHSLRAGLPLRPGVRPSASLGPDEHRVFFKLAHASWDELWMRLIPRLVDDEIELYRDEFPLILADLARCPAFQSVIAAAAALLPDLLDRLGIDRRRAIWLVPTAPVQREYHAHRPRRQDILAECAEQGTGVAQLDAARRRLHAGRRSRGQAATIGC